MINPIQPDIGGANHTASVRPHHTAQPAATSSRLWRAPFLTATFSLVVGACAGSGDAPTESTASTRADLTAQQCALLDVDRSLVVHDAATLGAADFSLQRTLQSIITTSGGAATTPTALLQSLLDDFAVPSAANPQSGLVMPVDVRAEAGLSAANLLNAAHADFMVPVALFNRLDLAPADGSHCGEYRIVYGKPNVSNGRFFLIFEAALPNPTPGLGITGCLPVAEFWGTLSDPALFPTPASRATALASFYYNGLSGFDPVVTHTNYGVPFGQIRSNHFLNFFQWQLREWRTGFDPSTLAATLQIDTTKQTPLAEYFDSAFVPGAPPFDVTDPLLFAAERADFQSDFLSQQLANLAAPELNGTANSAAEIVNGTGSAFPNRFNEFQSHSQSSSDIPLLKSFSGFHADVAGAAPAGLTADQLLNRAGAMTCGGCHQFSTGQEIAQLSGSPVVWPFSAGFVHVTESGGLSQALTSFFLPARMNVLRNFVCTSQGSGGSGGTSGAGGTGGGGGTSGAGGTGSTGGTQCGGPYGLTCSPYEYCSVCLDTGAFGNCQARPPACAPYGDAVCGCDGVTYANECSANMAGVAVRSLGACEPETCELKPRKGCCFEDEQCGRNGACVKAVCKREGEGVCKAPPKPGFCWEDSDCGGSEECVGARICPCGASCIVADQPGECRPQCTPDAAKGRGACDLFLGYRWNGTRCEGISGCSCVGEDCKALFKTADECKKAHAHCATNCIGPKCASDTKLVPTSAGVADTSTSESVEPSLQDVEIARRLLLEQIARSDADAKGAVLDLNRKVEATRAEEQAQKGAFVARRRTH